jgi:subtilisin family serine protease
MRRRGYRSSPATEATLNRIAKDYDVERIDGWPILSLGVYCEVFSLDENVEPDTLIAKLGADPSVESVQAMNVFDTLSTAYDDPYADLQPALLTLEIEEAHRLATGRGITVAVIDTWVDSNHPDFEGRITESRDFVGRNLDNNGNGDDIHGTGVTGVIASSANNKIGIVGVSPDVEIIALGACWQIERGSTAARCSSFTLARAIDYALANPPDIINLSLAGPPDPLLSRLLATAIEQNVIVVTASADSNSENQSFPASLNFVIATEATGTPTAGTRLRHRVSAPGRDILTTAPASGYSFMSGSSLAAAHVSGVVALMREREPRLTADQAAELLQSAEHRVGEQSTLSACKALAQLLGAAGCADAMASL